MLVSHDTHILLCDFGLAKIIGSTTSTSRVGLGTLRWQAPELWDGSSKAYESDVYAFGFTIYEVGPISLREPASCLRIIPFLRIRS